MTMTNKYDELIRLINKQMDKIDLALTTEEWDRQYMKWYGMETILRTMFTPQELNKLMAEADRKRKIENESTGFKCESISYDEWLMSVSY